jgi:hypothetical protein
MSDGRNIDDWVGILAGEAATQGVRGARHAAEGGPPFEVWSRSHEPRGTYYDRPVIKEPVWIWAVPVYFYAGGTAGAAAVLGATAQLVDRRGLSGLIRKARWIAAAGTAFGAALLIYDLGRPKRFLNMLRVFKPTSVLNMGSWILACGGSSSAAAAMLPGALGHAAGLVAGGVGLPMSGYTAVLLSDTAVPLWQQTRRTMPLLFVASAAASAASLLQALPLEKDERGIVHRLGTVAKFAELGAMSAVAREADRFERVGRPLREGMSGGLWRSARGFAAASLGLSLIGAKRRWARWTLALLGTAGALTLRFAVFHAGKASARDPHATFEPQRATPGPGPATP